MTLSPPKKVKFILLIGEDGMLCVPYKIADVTEPFFAAHNDAASTRKLIELLARQEKAPVLCVADILAQDYRTEILPRLSPFDRPKLLQRRLRQAFPQARLTASLSLNALRTHILMAGLQDKNPLFDWIEKLKNRTPAIALLPVEGASLAMKLLPDAKNGWAMLVTRQRSGGFRQIVTHKGELIFTRLTAPLPETASEEEIATLLQRDIGASLGYLARLGLNDTAQLRVLLLLPDFAHDKAAELALPVHSITCLSPFKAALHLQLPFIPAPTDAYADLLFAGWIAAKRRLRLRLMLPEMRKVRNDNAIRHYGIRTAFAVFLLAFILTGWHATNLASTLIETYREKTQLAELQKTLTAERQETASVTEPLGRLREAVERQRLFNEPSSLPWRALTLLNEALGTEARLVRLNWQKENGATAQETIQAELKLASFDNDREHIVASFQRIAQKAETGMQGYSVALSKLPYPALPDQSISKAPENIETAPTATLTIHTETP